MLTSDMELTLETCIVMPTSTGLPGSHEHTMSCIHYIAHHSQLIYSMMYSSSFTTSSLLSIAVHLGRHYSLITSCRLQVASFFFKKIPSSGSAPKSNVSSLVRHSTLEKFNNNSSAVSRVVSKIP